jgi:hypothetical protein
MELATKVILGQTLFLKNPETQDEAQAWVTRLGLCRGTWTQVGVEFVQPNEDFWSADRQRNPIEGTERRIDRDETAALQTPGNKEMESPQVETGAPHRDAESGPTLPDILLHALQETLQQAAEKVLAAATTARLTTSVNQGAESIENFSRGKIRQIEQRSEQYQQELVASVREEVLFQINEEVVRSEEHLRKRTAELLEGAALEVHSAFAERLRETANRLAAEFGEQAIASSTQHLAKLTEQAQISIGEARSQIDRAGAALAESQEKVKAETARAVSEAQQEAESLISQSKQVYAEWENRLKEFREELSHSAETESARFREHLQNVLAHLLSSLRL